MVKTNRLLLGLTLVFILVIAGCSTQDLSDLKDTKINSSNSIEIQKEEGNKSDAQIQQDKLMLLIADGNYVEEVSYTSPGGSENFKLTLDIKNDIVEEISLESGVATEIGIKKISGVNSALQTLVVGKNISEVEFPKVIAGASLTTKAFEAKLNELSSN